MRYSLAALMRDLGELEVGDPENTLVEVVRPKGDMPPFSSDLSFTVSTFHDGGQKTEAVWINILP